MHHPINQISASIKPEANLVELSRGTNGKKPSRISRSFDPVELVRRALDEPLDFPPLSAATVPGDRVAVAVDSEVPHVGEIVHGVVEALVHAGVDTAAISIVATDSETIRRCRDELEKRREILPQFVVHDPDDKDNLCVVGLTKKRHKLVVNRTIFDADIVLPIGCAGAGGGAYDALFPGFSDAEAINHYRTPANVCTPEELAKKAKASDEAGWLIGVLMSMQVVPGADESVEHVVAGEPQAVRSRCEELYQEKWALHSPRQVSLVIANISGGAESQNWQNVGRALASAEPLLVEGGAVAICSNLEQPPGESLSRLVDGDLEKVERKILHDHSEDSVPAWRVARALQRGPVYFLSQLDEETVEDLGFAPIDSVADLARLAGRHESCIVIDDSQHAIVKVEGD